VLDLAAGAGGKALALAAIMGNRGDILAFDNDAKRLKTAWSTRAPCRRHDHPGGQQKGRTGVGRRQIRCRARRCAVQRLGNVAAKSGVEVAFDARA